MAIFKCKMCGGVLEINNNETVATCEYCGSTMIQKSAKIILQAKIYSFSS